MSHDRVSHDSQTDLAGLFGLKKAPEEEHAQEVKRRLIHFKFEPMDCISKFVNVSSS